MRISSAYMSRNNAIKISDESLNSLQNILSKITTKNSRQTLQDGDKFIAFVERKNSLDSTISLGKGNELDVCRKTGYLLSCTKDPLISMSNFLDKVQKVLIKIEKSLNK